MKGKKRYQNIATKFAQRKESKPLVFSGELGVTTNGENLVEVSGRPGFVWVRLRNQLNELVQAFNESVSPVFDLPVLVEWDKLSPTRYKVINRDVGRYTVWGSASAYLPKHGSQHSFNTLDINFGGGGDVVWVYGQQFMPALVTPSGSAGAFSISMQPYVHYHSGTFGFAGGTGLLIPSDYKPPTADKARMFLIYLDQDTGNPMIATGTMTEFDATLTGTAQVVQYIPSVIGADDVPLAGLRLVTGTNEILWPNLYDVRQYF